MKTPDSERNQYRSEKTTKDIMNETRLREIQSILDRVIENIVAYTRGNSDIMDVVLMDLYKKTADYSIDVISTLMRDNAKAKTPTQQEEYIQGRLFYD